jgi:hypothetical protein
MDRSLRFRVCPHALHALFRLAFAPAPALKALTSHVRSNSPDHNAKGTQSHGNRPKTTPTLLPLVCTRVQVLFHSPSGVLFTFPSRYSPLSVTDSYLALEDGPPRFNRDFSCPGLLGYPEPLRTWISPTGLSPPSVRRSRRVRLSVPVQYPLGPSTPKSLSTPGFGLFPFRSPLLRKSLLISLPPGT